jgi:uncharacterized protein (DUF433 family)
MFPPLFLLPPLPALASSSKMCETFTMNTAIEVSHVAMDDRGRAWIDDTNVKVVEVVRDHLAYGWSPEEILWQHPHLTLAQIYAALAYYHDHRITMDAEIRKSLETAHAAARIAADSPLARRLQGLLAETE